ncbi:XkdF-like putative serine protease domain-containing protein [Campylobacter hyointestinalis]|uniref:XkdF-like putative serine protease domain-containing protein n=1 Tax=Campylobacter hyointestinalis TaxID=198 RepID=UPI000DCDC4A1|nr:XkdF-like putative serine protease domain-containing protein [Campylobacter hyointestinalis]RAZ54553.1 hypothetical protein CHL10074_07015 [Campylobacter hyointestinalis subsp. lawsonii]RAZ62917.1 hypothetical protein CHL9767_07840 [Campylobacter hyointestinalis subsp. lawsonii]
MASKLENLEVSCISLVKSGANKKSIIYKSGGTPNLEKEIKIVKSSDEGMVYAVVYSPDEIDTQGEFADANTIKKAAYGFMKSGFTKNIDKEHDFKSVDAYVAESWLIRKGDPLFLNEKEGSWAVGIKLESDELKAAVKSGEIAGISMAGLASKIEQTTKSEHIIDTFLKGLENIFKNSKTQKGENLEEQNVAEVIKNGFETNAKAIASMNDRLELLEKRLSANEDAIRKSSQAKETANENYGGIL